MKIIQNFQRTSKFSWIVVGSLLIFVIGMADYLTGYEISFSLFYLIPISVLAWYAGKPYAIAASIISAIVWFLAEIKAGKSYSHLMIYFWNSVVRLGFFLIVSLLLTTISKILKLEKERSSIDYLTGAANTRQFSELLQTEIDRSQRYKHPFTLAYFDLDNFKAVNDKYGHTVGDRLLRTVVSISTSLLRKTDTIARLGGDEFIFLLPETDQDQAMTVISRVQIGLTDEMDKENWPVTFSIGALTFDESPNSSDEAIKLVDDLMYIVKNHGKNAIKFSRYKTMDREHSGNDQLPEG